MKVLDLFSGIGGFSLGLERVGFETVAFCEVDPFCRSILKRHWPDVLQLGDIRQQSFEGFEVDVICGGFPCQDISQAGSRAGLSGSRSGLWREMLRAIRLVRPRYAIVENVAALLRRGMGTVLGDLAEGGFDAEWDCIPAAVLGAPDIRDRVWIISQPQYPNAHGLRSYPAQIDIERGAELRDQQVRFAGPMGAPLARALARMGSGSDRRWKPEPNIRRVVDGPPSRLLKSQLKAMGNAVKPINAELLGNSIMGK